MELEMDFDVCEGVKERLVGTWKTREHVSLHSLIHHKSHRDREGKLAAVEDVG
jgi:hypothetical protein